MQVPLNSLDATDVEAFTVRTGNSDVNPAVSVPILDLFTAKRSDIIMIRVPPVSSARLRSPVAVYGNIKLQVL